MLHPASNILAKGELHRLALPRGDGDLASASVFASW
jgi:hypothetical protein